MEPNERVKTEKIRKYDKNGSKRVEEKKSQETPMFQSQSSV